MLWLFLWLIGMLGVHRVLCFHPQLAYWWVSTHAGSSLTTTPADFAPCHAHLQSALYNALFWAAFEGLKAYLIPAPRALLLQSTPVKPEPRVVNPLVVEPLVLEPQQTTATTIADG